jgi:pimeloyl-ACP methyl ester carboxylesterase
MPIPFDDFGGQGQLLHFAHANGYPPACYRRLMDKLAAHYRVLAVRHRPLWPGSRPEEVGNWHDIADDMIRFFDEQEMKGVYGVGHSLGAVATMMAAIKRPDLFQAVVLIEPVILMPVLLEMFAKQAESGDYEFFPLVRITESRDRHWPDRQTAFDNFRSKRIFVRWDDETLWDYVQHGLHDSDDGGVELTYRPEWEVRLYVLPPTDVWELIPQLSHPTLAIRGAETDTLAPAAWELWQIKQPRAKFEEIVGAGHLLPMEEPAVVAATVHAFLARLP